MLGSSHWIILTTGSCVYGGWNKWFGSNFSNLLKFLKIFLETNAFIILPTFCLICKFMVIDSACDVIMVASGVCISWLAKLDNFKFREMNSSTCFAGILWTNSYGILAWKILFLFFFAICAPRRFAFTDENIYFFSEKNKFANIGKGDPRITRCILRKKISMVIIAKALNDYHHCVNLLYQSIS